MQAGLNIVIRFVTAGEALELLKARTAAGNSDLQDRVAAIIEKVKSGGDQALCRLSLEFDGYPMTADKIRISDDEIEAARSGVDPDFLRAIRLAVENITAYHQKQVMKSWFDSSRQGVILGQMVTPLSRVGIYVPGGKASYPSSVLMNAIPARVAGVREIAMVTPPGRDGRINSHTLAAAAEAGVTEIYRVGGAQAVAALAYGTETINRVDKITGPGNRYVTMAKKLVFGTVDIDMLAGPSEILVVADSTANPAYVAADLLSQAEHDEMASAILITTDRALARSVAGELDRQIKLLGRSGIAAKSVADFGFIIIAGSIGEAIDLANRFAPEHLELMVQDPFALLGRVKAAGAVFLGPNTPEPVGDYIAGPNHVLPTGGTARFFSPLGVEQFMKRTSVLYYSHEALEREAPHIRKLASMEGLDAHARSVEIRVKQAESRVEQEYDKGDEVSAGRFDVIQEGAAAFGRDRKRIGRELPVMPGFEDRGAGGGIPEITGAKHCERGVGKV